MEANSDRAILSLLFHAAHSVGASYKIKVLLNLSFSGVHTAAAVLRQRKAAPTTRVRLITCLVHCTAVSCPRIQHLRLVARKYTEEVACLTVYFHAYNKFGLSLPPLEPPTSEFGLLQHTMRHLTKETGSREASRPKMRCALSMHPIV